MKRENFSYRIVDVGERDAYRNSPKRERYLGVTAKTEFELTEDQMLGPHSFECWLYGESEDGTIWDGEREYFVHVILQRIPSTPEESAALRFRAFSREKENHVQ